MNKTIIILLAVCLVSVHCFVKRDAPEAPKADPLQEFQTKVQNMANEALENVKKALDPEVLKKGLNDFSDKITDAIKQFQPKTEAPKQ